MVRRRDGTGVRQAYNAESVLAVAVGVFNERGYDGTSMEDLARALGVSKSAIYHHVPGKEALLARALDRALDALEAAARERPNGGRAIDALEYLVRRSVEVLVAELPYVTLLLRLRGNTATERDALRRRRAFDRVVSGLVARSVAEGDVRPDVDPALTSRLLFGMVNSITEWYRPRHDADASMLVSAVLAVAFDGLRTGAIS